MADEDSEDEKGPGSAIPDGLRDRRRKSSKSRPDGDRELKISREGSSNADKIFSRCRDGSVL